MLGLAVLLQVEGVAHAAMGIRHALAAPGTAEVCTTEGTRRVAVDPALSSPDPGSQHAQTASRDHCTACSVLGGWSGLTPVQSFPVWDTASAASFGPASLARIATGYADHAARATRHSLTERGSARTNPPRVGALPDCQTTRLALA